jgi:hypothetical protein
MHDAFNPFYIKNFKSITFTFISIFQVLVFSQSLLSLDIIETFLKIENDKNSRADVPDQTGSTFFGSWVNDKDYYRMDGSTAPETRKKWCNFFNKVRLEIYFFKYFFGVPYLATFIINFSLM